MKHSVIWHRLPPSCETFSNNSFHVLQGNAGQRLIRGNVYSIKLLITLYCRCAWRHKIQVWTVWSRYHILSTTSFPKDYLRCNFDCLMKKIVYHHAVANDIPYVKIEVSRILQKFPARWLCVGYLQMTTICELEFDASIHRPTWMSRNFGGNFPMWISLSRATRKFTVPCTNLGQLLSKLRGAITPPPASWSGSVAQFPTIPRMNYARLTLSWLPFTHFAVRKSFTRFPGHQRHTIAAVGTHFRHRPRLSGLSHFRSLDGGQCTWGGIQLICFHPAPGSFTGMKIWENGWSNFGKWQLWNIAVALIALS